MAHDPIRLPPRRAKLHYTFDNNSLEEIGKTNFALLSKLNSIATRAPRFGEGTAATARSPPKLFKPRGATERERRAAQIDRDNLCVFGRPPQPRRLFSLTPLAHARHTPLQHPAAQDPEHQARGDKVHARRHKRAQPALGSGRRRRRRRRRRRGGRERQLSRQAPQVGGPYVQRGARAGGSGGAAGGGRGGKVCHGAHAHLQGPRQHCVSSWRAVARAQSRHTLTPPPAPIAPLFSYPQHGRVPRAAPA
jgi:hypothetical protein